MLLTRFWFVVCGFAIGLFGYVLFLAESMYDRAGARAMGEALQSDSQVVSWYLQIDARQRAAQLIKFAVNQEIAKLLGKATESEAKVPHEVREKLRAELRKENAGIDEEFGFDAIFAVDQHGRVVAHLGYDQASGLEDFELGGYPVVADALHGYIRDDTLVLDRIYRVVARPVELELGQLPAGAIVGARIVDDKYARELSVRTGAAVAFYANRERAASAAPEGFDKSQLGQIVSDFDKLEGEDPDYREKGRSGIRTVGGVLGVVYSRLPGEAWLLGAGFAVGRVPAEVKGPFGFLQKADDKDKAHVQVPIVGLGALLALGLGLIFSVLEHTRPIGVFRREAQRMAKGEVDQMTPSKFRGVFRKIASDLNDGIDQVAAKGGVPRRAADLGKVLGDLPKEPQMSAFAFGASSPSAAPEPSSPIAAEPSSPRLPKPPGPRGLPQPPGAKSAPVAAPAPEAAPAAPSSGGPPPPPRRAAAAADEDDPRAEWQRVFEEFVALKQQCGEPTEGFTYEKFEQTLIKNRDALVQRHGAKRVKFSVYVKDGKAALKASPIKD
ncbi:MAG: hypothetical protein IT376_06910 [Polyangiaceae bacterium]|nr:hypothetical protein [Polyangiaceae bacterium]